MEKNLDEAVKLLRKAAELGHKDAMVKLGELLSGTEEPFTKLLEKSYMEGYADGKNGKANKYLKVGAIITFGNYWQGKNKSAGKQPVEWQVLDVKDGKALVISKYGLINHEYNEEWTHVTWDICPLREWLNDTFIKDIFSAEEMKAVMLSDVSADENPIYDTYQGNDTKDKLFLLSIKEVEQYFVSKEKRLCKPTEYAVNNGADKYWWLRTVGLDYGGEDVIVDDYDGSVLYAGANSNYAALVGNDGSVLCGGDNAVYDYHSVRPAFWLNLQIYEYNK